MGCFSIFVWGDPKPCVDFEDGGRGAEPLEAETLLQFSEENIAIFNASFAKFRRYFG
jgi:hypothetical protein